MSLEEIQIEEPRPLKPIYVDGFGDYCVVNGVLRCTGFTLVAGQFPGLGSARVAVVKLIVSIAGADQAQLDTHRALRERPTPGVHIWNSDKTSH